MIKLVGTLTVTELDKMKSHYVMSSGDLMRIYQNIRNNVLVEMASALSHKATAGKHIEAEDYGVVTEDEVFRMAKTLSKHLTVSNPTILDCSIDTLSREIEKEKEYSSACHGVVCETCPYTKQCYDGEMSYKVMVDRIIDLIKKHSI